jgi:predicted Zn-dependent peptidase
MKLAKAVNLHVIKETKFKTIRVVVRFRELLNAQNVSKRVLISNLWEEANQGLPTGKAFSERLARMYGARFHAGVTIKGRQHCLTASLSVVDPQLVEEDTLKEGVDFLHDVIFRPLWDQAMFEREKTNLLHYLKSLQEDNETVAELAVARLFYEDKNQALPSVGTVESLQTETMGAVRDYFEQAILPHNPIDIFVLGNVENSRVEALFSDWKFSDRENLQEIFYQPADRPLQNVVEQKDANQSILAMAWRLPIQYGDRDYLALQLMNGLFGSLPHSKLFSIVRERESLAYEIGSSFDSFTGLYRVMAGIDAENFDKTKDLINSLLSELIDGNFTEDELQQTKDMLRNSYQMAKDNSSALVEEAFVKAFVGERFLDDAAWLSALATVTKADLQKVARQLKAQLVYFLNGSM